MAKFVRVHDPMETERRTQVWLTRAEHPELLKALAALPDGVEGALIRSILDQWFREHWEAGTLESAIGSFAAKRSIGRRSASTTGVEGNGIEATIPVRPLAMERKPLEVHAFVPEVASAQESTVATPVPDIGAPTEDVSRSNGTVVDTIADHKDYGAAQGPKPEGDFSLSGTIDGLNM